MRGPLRDESSPRRAGDILALAGAAVVTVGFFAAMGCLVLGLNTGEERYYPWAAGLGASALVGALLMLAGALRSARTAGGPTD